MTSSLEISQEALLQRRLVVRVEFGLGNRLLGLVSALALAEALGRRLTILWSTGRRDCLASFADVVDPGAFDDIEVIDPKDHDESWIDATRAPVDGLKRLFDERETVELRAHGLFGSGLLPTGQFARAVRSAAGRIRPSARVQELIGAGTATVGVHARLTDHLASQICTPRWCYRRALRELAVHAPGTRVLLCSDEAGFARDLAKTRGIEGVLQPSLRHAGSVDRFTVEGMQLAMADLWSLSRCRVILASPASSFSITASQLGGGSLHSLVNAARFLDPVQRRRMWWVTVRVRYDAKRARWHYPDDVSVFRPRRYALCAASLLCARFTCSRAYQDIPFPGRAAALRDRLTSFLSAHPLPHLATLADE